MGGHRYLLAETVATVLVGKFGDLFGRKVIFQVSAIIFITGSFLCGLASNMTLLIVWRGMQGIGAGGLMVTAMALIADVIPLRRARQVPGRHRCRLRCRHRHRPAARRPLHRPPHLALGFYVNVPIAILVVVAAARTIPVVKSAVPPGHRLPGHRPRRRRRQRPDPGDQLGRQRVRLELAGHHRPLRGRRPRPRGLLLGGDPRGRTDAADAAVRQPRLHGLLDPQLHRGLRDARRDDVPADLPAVRGRRLGHDLRRPYPAHGHRAAHRVGLQRQRRQQDRPLPRLPHRRVAGHGCSACICSP